jgi:hypothetical protein
MEAKITVLEILFCRGNLLLQYYIILREAGWGSMKWIVLTQDRNQCRAVVNMTATLGMP